MGIIIMLSAMAIIGVIAGLVAGDRTRYGGFGMDSNIIIGLFGSFAGIIINVTGIIQSTLGIGIGGLLGTLIWTTLGAALLLIILNMIKQLSSREED